MLHDRLKAQFCRVKLVQYSFVAGVLFTLLHKFINFILKGSLFIPLVPCFDFWILDYESAKFHFWPKSSRSAYLSLKSGRHSWIVEVKSSLSNGELFNFQKPGALGCNKSSVLRCKVTAEWSVSGALIMLQACVSLLSSFEIKKKSSRHWIFSDLFPQVKWLSFRLWSHQMSVKL